MEIPTMLIAAATATKAVGSIMQGSAQAAQYKAQAQANDYNAIVARQNADVALGQANAREEMQRRRFGELQGTALAAAAQSGSGMDGSNADVLKQNAVAAELDALTMRYEGQMQARGLMAQANMEEFQAGVNRANSRTARTSGYINAAADILGGASKAYTTK